MTDKNVLYSIKGLKKHFPLQKSYFSRDKASFVKAVDGVDLDIFRGETVGLIGESGCGKSTLSRVMLRLVEKTEGELLFNGESISEYKNSKLKNFRRDAQMIFQDPYFSIDPRMNIFSIISEPLRIHTKNSKKEQQERTDELLDMVGLKSEDKLKYPHEFSGGQRQRIGIARALAMNPDFVICDEPVSALDMSIQAQILNLLKNMQKKLDLTYLFISHDMSVIKHVSDRIAVMYMGRIVEISNKRELFAKTLHPYTKALMSAIPIPNPNKKNSRIVLKGDIPSPINPPPGCPFHKRCSNAMDICKKDVPVLKNIGSRHYVACHLYNEGRGL